MAFLLVNQKFGRHVVVVLVVKLCFVSDLGDLRKPRTVAFVPEIAQAQCNRAVAHVVQGIKHDSQVCLTAHVRLLNFLHRSQCQEVRHHARECRALQGFQQYRFLVRTDLRAADSKGLGWFA